MDKQDLGTILHGPMHTGRWTQYWRRRRDGKVRRAMKLFYIIMGLTALLAMFGIGMLFLAVIGGM